jgi:hypothetical protein
MYVQQMLCTRGPFILKHASAFYNIGEHHYDKIIKRRTLLLGTDREMARNNKGLKVMRVVYNTQAIS